MFIVLLKITFTVYIYIIITVSISAHELTHGVAMCQVKPLKRKRTTPGDMDVDVDGFVKEMFLAIDGYTTNKPPDVIRYIYLNSHMYTYIYICIYIRRIQYNAWIFNAPCTEWGPSSFAKLVYMTLRTIVYDTHKTIFR